MPDSAHILILTNERDFGVDATIRHLIQNGVPHRRLNAEDAFTSGLPLDLECPQESPKRVIWLRQFETSDGPPTTLAAAEDRLLARAQWRAWVSMLDVSSSVWVNPLWEARRAENKVIQLRVATGCGFEIPTTCITNSRQRARMFSDAHEGQVVLKALSAAFFELTDESFVFTQRLTDDLVDGTSDDLWARQPVILQEIAEAEFDARLVLFGPHHFGAKLPRSQATIDWRVGAQDQWEVWTPTPEVLSAACTYIDRLGLRYAAFDFLLRDDAVIFLEANQAGEWHFIDRRLDLGIAPALACYLSNLLKEETG